MSKELKIVEVVKGGAWVNVTCPEELEVGDYVRYSGVGSCWSFGDTLEQKAFEARKVVGFSSNGDVKTSTGTNAIGTDNLFSWKYVNRFVPSDKLPIKTLFLEKPEPKDIVKKSDVPNCIPSTTKVPTDKGWATIEQVTNKLTPKPLTAKVTIVKLTTGYGFVVKLPSKVKHSLLTFHEYTRKSDAVRAVKSLLNKMNIQFTINNQVKKV